MRLLAAFVLFATVCPGAAPEIAGCPVFPANNVWNTPVDRLPVAGASSLHISTIGAGKPLHPDFGEHPGSGIPYQVVGSDTKKVKLRFEYADESDSGPYPVPAEPRIEAGSDHHALIVDKDTCVLYELFELARAGNGWKADSGSVFELRTNDLRPDGWTSGDAAGLPILPGLVRYEEVQAGEIAHAIRFTVSKTRSAHIWPARHDASGDKEMELMPMGARLRLKASVDISRFSPTNQVILKALRTYGMILADTGSDWFISGMADSHWDDSDLHILTTLKGGDFEEVETSSMRISDKSGEARAPGAMK